MKSCCERQPADAAPLPPVLLLLPPLSPPPLLLLQTSLTKEVSLPGMMTAITEVEVSKEDKMRKIEETERIKHAMLLKQTGRWAGWLIGGTAGWAVTAWV